MRLITRKADLDELETVPTLDKRLGKLLQQQFEHNATSILGGDLPEENEDLRESMVMILLEPGDDWTKLSMIYGVPKQFSGGIPWDDVEVVHLADDLTVWASHVVCSDWFVLFVYQASNAPLGAFARWLTEQES